ncbi:MAG TPA: Lrp/AsnC family transcriptional regulator [Candidatus Nitrosocosmicus sp.]|nr:Lrp/AsnC family transcriptional regulator [Candidatus Nitrosocosmicus sp.]
MSNKKVKGNVQYSNDRFDNNSDELKPFLKKDNSLREKGLIASSYKKNIRKKQNGIATTIRGNETDSTQETVLKKDKDSGYGQNTSRNSNVAALNLDKINLKIIDELLSNADITSADIAKKIKIPLSTVQRRRTMLEKSVLKKTYQLNILQYGFRYADIFIDVAKGEAKEVGKMLVNKFDRNILKASTRINSSNNLCLQIVYKESEELHNLLEHIKRMPTTFNVDWSEMINIVGDNTISLISNLLVEEINKLDKKRTKTPRWL